MKKRGRILWCGLLLVAVCIIGLLMWYLPTRNKALCQMQLRNYNQALASCGISDECYEAWQDPKLSEELVLRLLGEKIPTCPSGGEYRIVCNQPPHYFCSKLICSHAESHGHIHTEYVELTARLKREKRDEASKNE